MFADGRTLAYEYDAEERITKVTDSDGTVTEYTPIKGSIDEVMSVIDQSAVNRAIKIGACNKYL